METLKSNDSPASTAFIKFFDCHDLLVKVASHLLPANRFDSVNMNHPLHDSPYTDIKNFVLASRTCRDAGNEMLYSEIHLSVCNVDGPILLYRTLKEYPHLADLVRYFDITSYATYDIRGVPTFGRRAVCMLLDCMLRLTSLRVDSPAIVEIIEPNVSRLDSLYLGLTSDRDHGQMSSDASGHPILLLSEAEMSLMARTRHVVLGGAVAAMIAHTPSSEAYSGPVAIRTLHLRSLTLHPDFVRDVLGGIWLGAITALVITDEHSSRWSAGPGTEPLWKDVIDALQSHLRYLRISEPRLGVWQLDLSHLKLDRLDLTLSSAAMPDLALFPASLHHLRIRASGHGRATRLLLDALASKDCLPSLKAIPVIIRNAPTSSEQHLLYEETIFAARDIALKSLMERGLQLMPKRSKRGTKQIWNESSVKYRAAVEATSTRLYAQQAMAGAWANTLPAIEQWQALQDTGGLPWMPGDLGPVWDGNDFVPDFAPDLPIVPMNLDDVD